MTTKKRVCDSATEQIRIVRPEHLNGSGTLFGGRLALWIDEVAGVVARRHCNGKVTTAAIDSLRFRKAAYASNIIILKGKLTYVGSSSMEVRVDSFVEDLAGDCRLINTAFVIMVALGEDKKPCPVPGLELGDDFEREAFAAGRKRKELRNKLNKELYD